MRHELVILTCAVVMATACSDDEEGPGQAFLGTWTTAAGVQTVFDCGPDFASKKENLSITYKVEKGDGADLVLTSSAAPECPLKANVIGQRAAVLEDQTCVRSEDRYRDTYRFATSSGLDLPQEGGATIKLEATFRRALADGTDTGFDCGYTEEAPIAKQ